MRLRTLLSGLVASVTMLAANRTQAVTDIRFERWSIGTTAIAADMIAPVDSVTGITLSFDATSTTADLSGGFRFAIAERDPDGDDVLMRIRVAPCSSFPAPGSPVTLYLSFTIYCDAQGRLHARDGVGWNVHWCVYPQEQTCANPSSSPAESLPSISEPENFELVALDENDHEGSFPTPEDALHSRALGPGQPVLDYVAPDFPQSGSIGIFADPGGNLCSGAIQPLVPFRWYIVAHLEGLLRCGVTTIELAMESPPPGLFLSFTPNPAALGFFGNLYTVAGMAFPCAHGGSDDALVLYTIDGISNVPLSDVALDVHVGNPPTNENWPYPWVESCPQFRSARRRMPGSQFIVNPTPGHECDGTVRIESIPWGELKSLYRETH